MQFLQVFLLLTFTLFAAAQNGKKILTYTDATTGQFPIKRTAVQWTSAEQDGTYVTPDSTTGSLLFVDIVTGEKTVFVDAAKLPFEYDDFAIQPSRENVLFATGYIKQYRYSFFADYWVYNRETGSVVPLVEDQKQDIQYAGWSAKGDVIAFVRANDLYLWKNGEIQRITTNGSPDMFNAVPDWVYEEEIFGDIKTLWFSPDGEYMAFLSFDETGVDTFTVPYYMDGQNVAPSYPRELDLRYPKVGTTNPKVSVHLLNVNSGEVLDIPVKTYPAEDLVISEVAWLADKHEKFIFRTMNRVQDQEKLVLVDTESGESKVVRERDGSDGWLDANMAITYIPGTDSYVDLSDHSGYNHIYLYPVEGGEPKALTKGEWEVISINKIDAKRGYVYYTSTERHPTERHVFRVDMKSGEKKALVDTKKEGYWGVSFSAEAGYYILSYNGPDVPYQKLYSVESSEPLQTLNDNAALKTKLAEYKLPKTSYYDLKHPSGYTLTMKETLPAKFKKNKKYPVLFDIYGGPGSQDVLKSFTAPGWTAYLGSDPELEYILISFDNRGTGGKGRACRSVVAKNLGQIEAEDQIWAAKIVAKKPYVDAEHIAIWGWSYGGYLTSKVVEKNSDMFSLGLITAPVSDWKFYDTLYTERYMKTPELNPAGYNISGVVDVTGFKNIRGGVLIQHGTGDDNVHFQHAAVMHDLLVRQGVTPNKLDSQWFTDSDHSINFHGAGQFLYRQLTGKLYDEKNRKKKQEKHQWFKRAERERLDKRRPEGWWKDAEAREVQPPVIKKRAVEVVEGGRLPGSAGIARRRVERGKGRDGWSGEGIVEGRVGELQGAGWKVGVLEN
ncbi:dipeptidyl aminopeptidase B [Ascodesmis nigricans]|uniref:dipeptidyl-peptidase IV n=1 Tax=Ascodesmis nigricans TaxID=341454 RepID=A0A4S2MN88_9PEZI|nr:dipeptidyl aminopeptidase B [Ascodesmis nigricans]